MTSEQPLTLEEFLVAIRPHLERQVDATILEADAVDHPFLRAPRADHARGDARTRDRTSATACARPRRGCARAWWSSRR